MRRATAAGAALALILATGGLSGALNAADLPALAAASGDGASIAAGGASSLGIGRPGQTHWYADRVHVDKSDRQLHLLRDGQVLRSYRISLGKNPVGDKQREGDLRTPEGEYYLDWRNPQSDFFMSMHISYPSAHDLREAEQRGERPGSMIMIHGLPNDAQATRTDYLYEDWTDGCIAVSNQAMIDIWLSVPDNTPITIAP